MKLILDVDSPVERGCLPIFAPLLPMKHAFCLARSTFSLFSLPLPSPSFILTIGQRNVSLSFLFACFYLVADPVWLTYLVRGMVSPHRARGWPLSQSGLSTCLKPVNAVG